MTAVRFFLLFVFSRRTLIDPWIFNCSPQLSFNCAPSYVRKGEGERQGSINFFLEWRETTSLLCCLGNTKRPVPVLPLSFLYLTHFKVRFILVKVTSEQEVEVGREWILNVIFLTDRDSCNLSDFNQRASDFAAQWLCGTLWVVGCGLIACSGWEKEVD